MNPQVFREYDIRGMVENDFDDGFVTDLGRAWATTLHRAGKKTVTLGRDCRLSSTASSRSAAGRRASRRDQRGRCRNRADAAALFFGAALEDGRRRDDHRQPQRRRVQRLQARGGADDAVYGDEIQQVRRIIEARDFVRSGSKGALSAIVRCFPIIGISSGASSSSSPG